MDNHQAPATRSDLNVVVGTTRRKISEALQDAMLSQAHDDAVDILMEVIWR
jgi:hypothetical protein